MRVGILGSGVVGRFIGRRLSEHGHELSVHDVDRSATAPLVGLGATESASPRELGASCDVVISCLPGPADLDATLEGDAGLHAAPRDGLIHVMTSTIGVAAVRRLAERSEEVGVQLIDAPLSAGPSDKGEVTLTVWVGARPSIYARLRPLLESFAPFCLLCGPVGHGQVVKLVNNVTTLGLAQILGETLCFGRKAGVPLETLRAGLTWGTAQNRLLDDHFGRSVFQGDWRPGYRVALAQKDLLLAQELAAEIDTPLDVAARLLGATDELTAHGWRDHSIHTLVRLAEKRAGVRLRLPGFEEREVTPSSSADADGGGDDAPTPGDQT